jgi:hypothetical protein
MSRARAAATRGYALCIDLDQRGWRNPHFAQAFPRFFLPAEPAENGVELTSINAAIRRCAQFTTGLIV